MPIYPQQPCTKLTFAPDVGALADGGILELTGDVTAGSGSGTQAATIAPRAVTVAKFQAIATASILGRTTAGSGDVEILTATQARSVIGAVNIAGDTMTGPLVNSTNGALSTPALTLTGAPITGGSSTTTKPLALIETAGATSTGWSTSGTMLGVNAPTGFTGEIVSIQLNGSSRVSISAGGSATLAGDLQVASNGEIRFSSDTKLNRDAANALALRNSTNAQTFRIYNTYTDASNYERGVLSWASNEWFVGTESGGTGSSRNFILQSSANLRFRTAGSNRWQVDSSGNFNAVADNSYDIGASGATRPRNLFIAGGITHGSATLLTTTTALTNGAAAQVGTLTNAPAAGNPTKWIPIADNGTTRYIPAW